MKVLLLQHVKNLGREGDIIDVADGYAVNSLFPQKKAVQATAKIINDHKTKKKAVEARSKKAQEQTLEALEKLNNKNVTISEKMNEKNTLYHGVGNKEISKAIVKQYNISLSNDIFKETYSFKEAGSHNIVLEAYGKKAVLQLEITAL